MTGQARDEEDNTTNRAAWRNKIISYTGDPRWRDKPGTKKTTQQTGQHGGIRSSAILTTPDDGTSQGWRRQHNKQGSIEEWDRQLYRRPQMTGQARDEEDNTTNRAACRNKIISYTGDPRWRDKPGMKKTTQQTGQHGGIRSSAIPATPDDGTSQGWRRQHNKQGSLEE